MLKTHTPICSHSIKQFKSNKWQNNTIWPLQLRDGKSRHCHYSHFVDEKTELQNSSESHLWISFSHIRLWVSIPSTRYQCSPFLFLFIVEKDKTQHKNQFFIVNILLHGTADETLTQEPGLPLHITGNPETLSAHHSQTGRHWDHKGYNQFLSPIIKITRWPFLSQQSAYWILATPPQQWQIHTFKGC